MEIVWKVSCIFDFFVAK